MNQTKSKILIIFYSMYGHIFRMANAAFEGVREAGGLAKRLTNIAKRLRS